MPEGATAAHATESIERAKKDGKTSLILAIMRSNGIVSPSTPFTLFAAGSILSTLNGMWREIPRSVISRCIGWATVSMPKTFGIG